MAVAERHRHAVERRIVAARDLLPRAKNPGAAVDVVDEADEVEAALAGEIAHHLSELARAVDQDLLHRSEEHTSELQSLAYLVCRLLLEKKKNKTTTTR